MPDASLICGCVFIFFGGTLIYIYICLFIYVFFVFLLGGWGWGVPQQRDTPRCKNGPPQVDLGSVGFPLSNWFKA